MTAFGHEEGPAGGAGPGDDVIDGLGGEAGAEGANQAGGVNAMPKDTFAENRAGGKRKVRSLAELTSVSIYLKRIGAEATSLTRAVVQEPAGNYHRDVATLKFAPDGTVTCREGEEHLPTSEEQALIKAEWAMCAWPEHRPFLCFCPVREHPDAPDEIKNAPPENVFEFRDQNNCVVMVEVRVESKDGIKALLPFTFWSDDYWRRCGPPDALPLYNAHLLNGAGVVFLHEGAKAARAVQEVVEAKGCEGKAKLAAHPWGAHLQHGVHLGWVGGAPNPNRTDWSVLRKAGVTRVTVVADNDGVGVSAVPKISKALAGMRVDMIRFDDRFPARFDLADAFPEKMFKDKGGIPSYDGPSFLDCLHPATWATATLKAKERGRPPAIIRPEFAAQWAYVDEHGVIVNRSHPERRYGPERFDAAVRPYSSVARTSPLLVGDLASHVSALDYRPDRSEREFSEDGRRILNAYRPPARKAVDGDAGLFLRFLDHLVPHEGDRREVQRWVASLIARPAVKLGYALLLISAAQGVGKTTLATILKELVGPWNASEPRAEEVAKGRFNAWAAERRLVVINELYSGEGGRTTYDAMKSLITDPEVSIERKGLDSITMSNFANVFATSNSELCLHMPDEDRRWLIPDVTEQGRTREYWRGFYSWLEDGGYEIILGWALRFGDYVERGAHAPISSRKRQIIEDSRTPGVRLAIACAEELAAQSGEALFLVSDVHREVQRRRNGVGRIESAGTLRKAIEKAKVPGIFVTTRDTSPKVDGERSYVVSNFDLQGETQWKAGGLREKHVELRSLMDSDM